MRSAGLGPCMRAALSITSMTRSFGRSAGDTGGVGMLCVIGVIVGPWSGLPHPDHVKTTPSFYFSKRAERKVAGPRTGDPPVWRTSIALAWALRTRDAWLAH